MKTSVFLPDELVQTAQESGLSISVLVEAALRHALDSSDDGTLVVEMPRTVHVSLVVLSHGMKREVWSDHYLEVPAVGDVIEVHHEGTEVHLYEVLQRRWICSLANARSVVLTVRENAHTIELTGTEIDEYLTAEAVGKCDRCARKTWSEEKIGERCLMPQPNSSFCAGEFARMVRR